ncbi:MAG: endopeptidase La [bacterium]|jgi:ATP-dependent Lon protease|nr:endopeptidase La [bacterium]
MRKKKDEKANPNKDAESKTTKTKPEKKTASSKPKTSSDRRSKPKSDADQKASRPSGKATPAPESVPTPAETRIDDTYDINEDAVVVKSAKSQKAREEFPLLPLRDVVIFPGMIIPLFVGRPKSVAALEAGMQGDKRIVLVAQKKMDIDEPMPNDLYDVGTIISVLQLLKLPDGSIKVLIEGIQRVQIERYTGQDPFFIVETSVLEENVENGSDVQALMRHVRDAFESYVKLNRKIPQETLISIMNLEDPGRLGDSIAAHLTIKVADKQRLLASSSPSSRLRLLSKILASELEILELEQKLKGEVRKQMEQSQKEYYLHEQIKAIQRELGKDNDGNEDWEKYRSKIKRAKMSKEAETKAMEELERLAGMAPLSPEATVVRNYLDWLCELPWAKSTPDRHDIKKAEQILEEDHYGLAKPKERILEFLAVHKLKKTLKGPILCFVGPPGVGKTSLGRSIAGSLGRKFVRISLGGVRDEAEIRGHRRTYIGSMPGRIIQSLKKCKSNNPVFLLDEIDKMSMDFRGDPSSALLEVLDPEQNATFSDHYLEVEFDLSNVMFIATANVTHTIPAALHDRMEIIEIPSYTEEDKVHIAQDFLVPKQLKNHGLIRFKPEFNRESLQQIIRDYTREAGVRNLEREIASVCRKLARKATTDGLKKNMEITAEIVNEFLGIPKFRETQFSKENGIGSATGLAVTSVGGEILNTEVMIMEGTGQLILTGKLGEVMQESAKAALSFARTRARLLNLARDFYKRFDIHIHVPEGAIPKDGPSAGITIATSLISALTGRPVADNLAMTGELTLRGRVLAIGGVKEKVLAAHRADITRVILPDDNRKDVPDIPDNVLEKMEIHFVKTMDEVLAIALPEEIQ